MEFITKLARRSIFVYPTIEEFREAMVEYNSYEDIKRKRDIYEGMAKSAKAYIGSKSMDIATMYTSRDDRLLSIDDDALELYKDYKMYCTALGNGLDFVYKSVQLEQTHRSWKMLKLAGTFALWDCRDTITIDDIEESIYVVEKLGDYMKKYEEYASKNEYEHLADYFMQAPEKTLTLHNLKKRGFIGGTSNLENKVKELVRLANSYAKDEGLLTFEGDMVKYKQYESVESHNASYIQVSGSKEERAFKCHNGYEYKPTAFDKLKVLLENDTAYSPFKFKDGKRSNDNIASGATWAAIDVDDADIDIYEMHDILGDYNHHIATTSNKDNLFKYRIILEFNKVVDLPPREWKSFMLAVAKELGLEADPSAYTKSQIQFGYKDSIVLSENEAEPFNVVEPLKEANKIVGIGKQPQVSITQARKLLDDPLNTFKYAFSDDVKSRSLSLYKLWKHIKDLGGREAECEQLMRDLNYGFWTNGVSDKRFESYILQMQRSFEEER